MCGEVLHRRAQLNHSELPKTPSNTLRTSNAPNTHGRLDLKTSGSCSTCPQRRTPGTPVNVEVLLAADGELARAKARVEQFAESYQAALSWSETPAVRRAGVGRRVGVAQGRGQEGVRLFFGMRREFRAL